MKKFHFLLLLLLFVYPVAAQEGKHIGFTLGGDNVWILNQNNYEVLEDFADTMVQHSDIAYVIVMRYHTGFTYTHQWDKYDAIRAGLFFTDIGQTYQDSFVQQPNYPKNKGQYYDRVRRTVNLYSLQLPIQYRFRTNSFGAINWYVTAGPCFSYVVKARERVMIGDTFKSPSTFSLSASKKFSKFNIGLSANTGLSIKLNKQWYLEPGFSVYYGMFDINSKALRETGWYSKNDNRYFPSFNVRFGVEVGIHYSLDRYAR